MCVSVTSVGQATTAGVCCTYAPFRTFRLGGEKTKKHFKIVTTVVFFVTDKTCKHVKVKGKHCGHLRTFTKR